MVPFKHRVTQVIEVSAALSLTDIALTGFLRIVIAIALNLEAAAARTLNAAVRPAQFPYLLEALLVI